MRGSRTNPILATLDRLAAAEREFLRAQFLAPVTAAAIVRVRIAGVVCAMQVEPRDFTGWGIFQPLTYSAARLIRPATMTEQRSYLTLFPAVSIVMVREEEQTWFGVPAQRGDCRFYIDDAVPIRLAQDCERFDTVRARFDGAQFRFDELDVRADPGAAAYLREMLTAMTEPAALSRPGLTAGQREAYACEFNRRRDGEAARAHRDAAARAGAERATAEYRVRRALEHAGARFRDVADRGDSYRVVYEVDGRRHTSLVRKGDLTVQAAGICLSGGDRAFDLHSLVGVIREGARDRAIVPTM
jgi:hypothetical protein